MIHNVDILTWARVLGLLVPFVVAFITKAQSSSKVKGWVHAAGVVIAGAIPIFISTGHQQTVGLWLNSILNAFVVSGVAYFALYKPTGLSEAVSNVVPMFGFGKPDPTKVANVDVPPKAA
jgi:uncharacterized membrane protein